MIHRFSRCSVLGIFFLVVFFVLNLLVCIALSSSNQNTSFLWSFAAITGSQDQRKLVAITSDSALYSGDKFKLMFETRETCYVYIIFKGSQGEIVLLYPKRLESGSRPPKVNKKVFIPNERGWFTLDQQSGTEALYLLVSSKALRDLEALLKQYDSASLNKKDAIAQSIVMLIGEKERSSQPLTAAAEKPIQIGGTIRDIADPDYLSEDISKFAQEIAVDDLLIRNYSVEHR